MPRRPERRAPATPPDTPARERPPSQGGGDDGSRPAAPPAALLRRAPRRARGHDRVDRLLNAAAEVIAEVGVDAASTNAIAARADTSVGSLYQFFPSKDALVQALAARYVAAFAQLKDRVFAPEIVGLPLPAMMRAIVEPLAAFVDAHPAYRHVYPVTRAAGSDVAATEAALHAAIVARVEALVGLRMPWLPAAQRRVVAVVQVETVHAVLFHAQERPHAERPALYEELVRTLAAALAPLDHGPSPSARDARSAAARRRR